MFAKLTALGTEEGDEESEDEVEGAEESDKEAEDEAGSEEEGSESEKECEGEAGEGSKRKRRRLDDAHSSEQLAQAEENDVEDTGAGVGKCSICEEIFCDGMTWISGAVPQPKPEPEPMTSMAGNECLQISDDSTVVDANVHAVDPALSQLVGTFGDDVCHHCSDMICSTEIWACCTVCLVPLCHNHFGMSRCHEHNLYAACPCKECAAEDEPQSDLIEVEHEPGHKKMMSLVCPEDDTPARLIKCFKRAQHTREKECEGEAGEGSKRKRRRLDDDDDV